MERETERDLKFTNRPTRNLNKQLGLHGSVSLFIFYYVMRMLTPFFLSHARLRSANAVTAQIAVIPQSNFESGTCSRSMHSNFLGRRSNPCYPRFRPTNRPQVSSLFKVARGRFEPTTLWLQDTYRYTTTSKLSEYSYVYSRRSSFF